MKKYQKYVTTYLILLILLGAAFGAALCFGSVSLSWTELWIGLFPSYQADTPSASTAAVILQEIRLPRIVAAALAGAALAAAGTVLQCVTGNDLCAPNIVGINSGAGFAVLFLLCLAPGAWRMLPLAAFCGACSAAALVMGFAFGGRYCANHTSIVLAGVAVSSILSAGISFLSLRFPDVLTSYTAFSVGGFAGITLTELLLPAVIIAISLFLLQLLSPQLNTLCLGDEIAFTLGISVKRLRILALLLACALCAAAVSFAGLLGFVGLIVPHIVRKICGTDLRFNITLSALMGSILVILSDLLGRTLFAPSELPAGILMALLGAPFFLYLLLRQRAQTPSL